MKQGARHLSLGVGPLGVGLLGVGLVGVGRALGLLTGCEDYRWKADPSLDEGGWLLSVWGPSADNLYAVGGEPGRGRIVHFDGASWEEVELGLEVPLLDWVFGFGPDDVTVVGDDGTILHYDGATWSQATSPTDENLWGVWGAAPDDLWAVGGRGFTDSVATILHYDGSAWTEFPYPPLERARVNAFFKIWGTSADNVYIVGQRGVVLRYDGSAWTELFVGASTDLISLWGTGPDHIAIVGGRNNGVVVTWDGSEWRVGELAPLLGLNGVWMRRPGTIHAVGREGMRLIIDFDSLTFTEQPQSTRRDFHAVFGDPGGSLTAVGGNLLSPTAPYYGLLARRHLRTEE